MRSCPRPHAQPSLRQVIALVAQAPGRLLCGHRCDERDGALRICLVHFRQGCRVATMPTAPRAGCAEPGCPGRAVTMGRCANHASQQRRRSDQQRGTRTQRGYDNDWLRTVRAAIRAQPWCSWCLAVDDLTGDHIVPKSKGGSNDASNVRVLCRSCNSRRGNGSD